MKFKNYLNERAADPEQKEIAKQVKNLYKKLGLKASIKSSPGKAGYIQTSTYKSKGIIPADLRNLALDLIYSPSFERDRENPNAGNVRDQSINMRWHEWKKLLSMYK
jgi:hypothetical protein